MQLLILSKLKQTKIKIYDFLKIIGGIEDD